MTPRLLTAVVLSLCVGMVGRARASSLYLELDGRWYALPTTAPEAPFNFSFDASSGYPSIYLPTAGFTLCAPTTGSDEFGATFLFYGPTSFPIYSWKTLSWAGNVRPGVDVITVTTVNGTIACTGEIPSPLQTTEPTDRIFADGFEINGMTYIAGDTIFLNGFAGNLMP